MLYLFVDNNCHIILNKNQQKMNQTCHTPTNKKRITFDLEEFTKQEREDIRIKRKLKSKNFSNIVTPKNLDFDQNIVNYSEISLCTKQDNTNNQNRALGMKKMCSFEMGTRNEINYDSKLLKSSSMMNQAC